MNFKRPHSAARGNKSNSDQPREHHEASAAWKQPRPLCVDPKTELPAVYLKSGGWWPIVYRKKVDSVDRAARAGDWVAVYGEEQKLIGYGLYNPRSEVAVRMIRWGEQPPDETFWNEKITAAVSLRKDLLRLDDVTDAYRLIHAEGDGLSGLMIDRYGDVLSAEAFSLAMFQRAGEIMSRIAPLVGAKHTILRPSPQFVSQEGCQPQSIESEGVPSRVTINEFGTRFRVQFAGGHKTGFFCDQRENRKRLAEFCAGKTVLDLCCYTGGFSVQAKKLGQASEVTGVDLDEAPLEIAKENANLNQVRVKFVQADAFAYMRDMLRGGRKFDVVILDPPKLIRGRAELEEGTRKHFDLNRLAMQLVAPGGLLLSCTCSGMLRGEEFLKLLHSAARQAGPPMEAGQGSAAASTTSEDDEPTSLDSGLADAGTVNYRRHKPRAMQVLLKTGAAPDHPVASNCPESEYLNAVWMRME